MKLNQRDRRAVLLLAPAVLVTLVLRFGVYGEKEAVIAPSLDSAPVAEKRLAKARGIAATIEGRQKLLVQASAELAGREKGILSAETAAQAQAQMIQILGRVGKAEGIDVRGGEIGQMRPLGEDYGQAEVAVSFQCGIEQFVNFLAALTQQPEAIATSEIRISGSEKKEKTINVRMVAAGLVPRALLPTKKGMTSF